MPIFAKGNNALITGGASGIGLAIAKLCVGHGMRVLLIDRNKELLDRAKAEHAESVEAMEADVSSKADWGKVKEKVAGGFMPDLVCLNAGIGLKGGWEDADYFRKIFDVNFFGVVEGIAALLPEMKKSGRESAIVITGSKQGITNPPGNPAYNASKSAIKTLAEHLSYDLRSSPIAVHLLVPGWTYTGLSGGHPGSSKPKPDGAWTPEQVAEYMETRMNEGKFYIICPDNDVTEEKDKKRMLWTAGDAVEGRPPLTRWREEWKDKAEEWMAKLKI